MIRIPGVALATIDGGADPGVLGLALLGALNRRGRRVQHFRSQACPTYVDAAGQIAGLPGRHLDAWLMPPPICRSVYARGAAGADLAVVEGVLGRGCAEIGPAGACGDLGLGPIARTLSLPVVAVVPCPRWSGFHMPNLPAEVDAVILDGLEDPAEFAAFRHLFRVAARRPVLGSLGALPEVRAALAAAPQGRATPADLVDRLATNFLRTADLDGLEALASDRAFLWADELPARRDRRRQAFRVAFAHDEAFGGYFPDMLETLEDLGADLVEFSPLSDGTLPAGADLVIIGCGYPDEHADALAANLSMISSLQEHVCRGRRIYAESGGAAYLGRGMILGGRRVPGAGILPFDAEVRTGPCSPSPVARRLVRDSWLGQRGTLVRGYHSGRWDFRQAPDPSECPGRAGPLTTALDMYARHHAVGGLLHLHLASLPEVVAAFAEPHPPSLTLPGRP